MGRWAWIAVAALALGCEGDLPGKEIFDFTGTFAPEKADLWNQAVLVEAAEACGTISGSIDAAWEVRGLVVEALAGQTLEVEVGAWAGQGSADRAPGEPLDTVAAVYGPMEGWRAGPLLGYADDSGGGLQAALEPVEVPADGVYVAVLTSWDDPGQGRFELGVFVEGAGCEP